ncbi:DUF5689 domain-containing protein [Epilithonimonas sp.]|uniref:DUF5689 domain-containing protein n=1 Tax=Epilithonimonas sp. TaxID=2894511 RepID=UPI002FDEBB36
MKTYTTIKTLVFSAIVAMTYTSCVKDDDWNAPEILCNNRFDEPTTTMAAFAALAPTSGTYKIPADGAPIIFDAYIVSSDENGNFYKTISFQDKAENPTVGLSLEVDKASNYADFPVGAHIRIKANGLVLGWDRGTRKIGSIDPTYAIGRIPSILLTRYLAGVCNGNNRMDIATLVPTKLPSLKDASAEKYLNTLVSVDNVQFAKELVLPQPTTFINYIAGVGQDTDRAIIDKTGETSLIRNSGFSTFGSKLLPKESGELTFVVSRYNSGFQMLIRSLNDINFTKERFATGIVGGSDIKFLGSFTENFESYPANAAAPYFNNFPKYINYAELGSRYWEIRSFNSNKYIQLSANAAPAPGIIHTYFIVPVDFTAANSFAFKVNVGFYNGDALKVYTTTNYTAGSDISTATLTDITSNFTVPKTPASGYGTLAPAGTYNIPASVTGNGFIVFKYEGVNPGVTTTVQIDDIVVN